MKPLLTVVLLFATSALFGLGAPEPESGGADPTAPTGPSEGETRVDESDLAATVAEGNRFSFDLFELLAERETDNVVASPHSVRIALSMIYAGAEGRTAAEIEEAGRLVPAGSDLHPAMGALDDRIAEAQGLELSIANGIWIDRDASFVADYLDTLARYYGAGAQQVDFDDPEETRARVNDWVAEQTAGNIEDLLPQGSVSPLSRMILANAVYFNAKWQFPFRAAETVDAPFSLADGSEVSVPTMHRRIRLRTYESESATAAVLPYVGGDFAMTVLMPAEGGSLDVDADEYLRIRAELYDTQPGEIELALPKFEFSMGADLIPLLQSLGMSRAFSAQDAELGGISREMDDLHITGAFHRATITVDEEGTEASAATGMVASVESAVPVFRFDRPFLFAIEHVETGAILFLGRLADPRG